MRVDWVVNDVVSVGCDVGYWVLSCVLGVLFFLECTFWVLCGVSLVFVFVDLAGM